MAQQKFCILLTGTIMPENTFLLERSNVEERENDYYTAIKHWIQYDIPIIFCENSNYNSEKIKAISSPNFEFIQYKETEDLSTKGKGFGEFLLMQYAIENSAILKKFEFIIKITGRLYFKNFKKIFKAANTTDFDVMAPLESNLKWSDSRLFIFHRSFFNDYFIQFAEKINDSKGFCFERALACGIHSLLADNKVWEMLPYYPRYIGYSGTRNKKYTLLYKFTFIKVIKFPLLRYLAKTIY